MRGASVKEANAVRRSPDFHASALRLISEKGLETAWETYWAPLFSRTTSVAVVDRARKIALRRSIEDITRGITVFHTRPSRDHCLSAFPGPVTIITGSDDVAPGLRKSAAQAEAAVDGHLRILSDCGHYVPLERPVELNQILSDVIAARA